MTIRDFLRGGYRNLTTTTVVTRNHQPLFTVSLAAEYGNGAISPQNAAERPNTPAVALRTVRNRTRGS
jgi:hypothetical protein